jgi:small subunit ribosomal protein S21
MAVSCKGIAAGAAADSMRWHARWYRVPKPESSGDTHEIEGHPYTPVRTQRLTRSLWAGRTREVVMVRVIDQQLDKALRLLKRQLAKDGTWRELKARAFYEKPSVKKRRRQLAVRRRLLKLEKMLAE